MMTLLTIDGAGGWLAVAAGLTLGVLLMSGAARLGRYARDMVRTVTVS